jgi:hypothetical protein
VTLHLSGFDPVPVGITAQGDPLSCVPAIVELTPRDEMTLTGQVRNTAGNPEPDARIRGCGPALVQDDGTFTVKPVRAPCTLSAVRRDGFWFSRSEHHEIPWLEGGDYEVALTLNEYPRGGMGIGISAVEEGIVVEDVHAGSPAAQAGLQEGDLIIALEGEPTAGMPVSQFVAEATGEAGSNVTVVVANSDGDERTITLTREVLGP